MSAAGRLFAKTDGHLSISQLTVWYLDGANGLLVTIYIAFFIVLLSFDHSVLYVSLITALLTFALYNILIGRVILGDFGAYVLSALVAFNCLKIYGQNDVSVFLFART